MPLESSNQQGMAINRDGDLVYCCPTNLGKSDVGKSEICKSEICKSDISKSEICKSEISKSDSSKSKENSRYKATILHLFICLTNNKF